MENVRQVLELYQVYPIDIEKVTDRLFYVKDNKKSYALKRSSLTEDNLSFWLEIYRIAQAQNLQNVLPVYVNRNKELFSKAGNDIYYLSPWIEANHRTYSIDKIYQQVGFIHSKTRKTQGISDEMRDNSREEFLVYKKQMEELRKKLLDHVQHFESQHFMSPVGLLVCTQYRDLAQVFFVLEKRLNKYIESLQDIPEWSFSLNHGKIKDSHVLHGNQLFFINWENATFQHPIVDLSVLLKDRTQYHDMDKRLLLDKFKYYTEENKLENHELTLLSIYLLDPSIYLQTIEHYTEANSELRTIDYVIKLQRYHRQLLFGLNFSQFVEEEFELVSLDESSSES